MIEEIKKIPKVELHLHLDGSVSLELASNLLGHSIEDIKREMVAPLKCHNLSEYLTRFELPIQLMQTKENLTLIAKDLVDYLETQNVIYAEIRFAPMFHTKNGLSYKDVVESVLLGLDSNSHVKTNLILCLMRGMSSDENWKTLEIAYQYLHQGVCAIDLAGAEDQFPIDEYLIYFKRARSLGIPFTIHAGENGGADEVRKAIQIGATRIGHGIHITDNQTILDLVKERQVLLEVCPTSNVQTNAVESYEVHPLYKLYKSGVLVCINTDNPTVSNITLNEEYIKLFTYFHFDLTDYQKMNIYAIEHAFLSEKEKKNLLLKLKNY